MIDGYESYRPSGFSWLGEIPEHWKASLIKRHYNVTLGKMLTTEPKTDRDTLHPYLKAANIQWAGIDTTDLNKMWFSPEEKEKLRLQIGDLIVSEGGDAGRVAVWSHAIECYIQNAALRIRESGEDTNQFLYYWLQFIKRNGLIDIICNKSTIAHYTAEKVEVTEVVLPPPEEQIEITRYLNNQTSRIDSLISEKQRFIELLKEKRQALISHVVTKGLDANVEMKDSGVEWMGSIPAHWNVKKLKTIGKAIIGLTYSPDDVQDDGTIVLRSTNIQEGKISLHDNVYVDKQIPAKLTTKLNDILICSRNGSRKLIGKNALIDEKSVGMSFGAFTTVFRSDINKFVHLLLNSSLFDYQAGMFLTTTVNQLTTGMLNNFEVPVPPIEEQSAIVDEANRQTEKFDLLIKETICSIDLLKEHRSALISAAVTGKIDVRGFDNKGAA